MPRRISTTIAFLGWAALSLPAQQALARVQVSAQGEFRANPDTAVVQMEVTGHDRDLKVAYAQAQSQAGQVRMLLQQQGFSPQQAHWTSYQVQPNLDYRTRNVTDYSVTTSLQVEVSDFSKIEPLVEAAGSNGLSALRGVSFELKDMEVAKAAAIADGYRKARQEAEALARAAGRQIQDLESASVDVSLPSPAPVLMEARAAMAAPAPMAEFSPGEITVTAHITAAYRLRP